MAGPTQEQINAANAAGQQQGNAAGTREAQERAPSEGKDQGFRKGRGEGFERCEREERDRAHDSGLRYGFEEGRAEGGPLGADKGRQDGQAQGQSDGNTNGLQRADNDSRAASAGPGRDQGVSEGNTSDASARGNTDGIAAGDSDALSDAQATYYPRARADYRNQRVNEAVQTQDGFNNKESQTLAQNKSVTQFLTMASLKSLVSAFMGTKPEGGGDRGGDRGGNSDAHGSAAPDHRFATPTQTFPSTQEQEAYKNSYMSSYDNGFTGTYGNLFKQAFDNASRDGQREGCDEARHRDYREAYAEGRREGHRRGYEEAYNTNYAAYKKANYDASYPVASDNAYRNSYQGYYAQHFEEARSAAYAGQVRALYDAAFTSAHDQTYAAKSPAYQQSAYQKGLADEAADFAARPVRLTGAQATETIVNGVFEPGEALRVQLSMRNFADGALSGKDVKVKLEALDSRSAVISIAEESLLQDLKAKSVTTVGQTLEFRMNENTVNHASKFRVTLSYQGRNVGQQIISVDTSYMVDIAFAESPELSEGVQTTLKVRVRNQSNQPTDAGLAVTLSSKPESMEVLKPTITVGVLNPGEVKVLEFPVIDHAHGAVVQVPMAFSATLGTGRRVGMNDLEQNIALKNDYVIQTTSNLSGLRSNSVTRVSYSIRNVSSRLLLKSLQLKISVAGPNSKNFVVVGPNPQFLEPLLQGQTLSFGVPVLSQASNSGGTLQLEVQEDGRTVIINQTDF